MIILSSILIISCAASLGATYASGAGAVAAISIVLSGNGSIEVGGMLAICGLTAGMFIDYGKFVVTSVYIFTVMLISMLYASDVFYIMNWQSLSFCLICGLLLPNSFLYKLNKQLFLGEKINRWRSVDGTAKQILELSKCLDVLKNVFNDVSITDTAMKNDNAHLMQEINLRACKDCEMEKTCWEKDIYNTYRVLGKVVSNWDEMTAPDINIIYESHMKECKRLTKLIEAVNETYNIYKMQSSVSKEY